MKKYLILLLLFPINLLGQYIQAPTHYNAEHTAQHIIKGHLKMFCSDSIKYTVEKKNERYITDYDVNPQIVKSKLDKIFQKGNPEFSGRTNGGYLFTIAVIDPKDETKIVNYCTFHVDAWTQKIVEIEILLGE